MIVEVDSRKKPSLHYRGHNLYLDGVKLVSLVKKYQTPLYVYSLREIEKNLKTYVSFLKDIPHRICYAVKANSNLSLLKFFAKCGCGFDIVSTGELARVLAVGANPSLVVYSGVGKRQDEIDYALSVGVGSFQIESLSELILVSQRAKKLHTVANISIRINPEVDPKTHHYIATGSKESKFGINIDLAKKIINDNSYKHCRIKGIACHIGSQITTLQPYKQAIDVLLTLAAYAYEHGIFLEHINIGGGIGIKYNKEKIIKPKELISLWRKRMSVARKKNPKLSNITLYIEPGRSLVGSAGVLLTRVVHLKNKDTRNQGYAIVDAGMNDLPRPALYSAYHGCHTLNKKEIVSGKIIQKRVWDIVGPICESGDYLSLQQKLAIQQNSLIAVENSGAYCFTMSSNYNSRPRAAEVLVSNNQSMLIRKREELPELFQSEVQCLT